MQLKNIPLNQIIFGERKREDYGDIEDLALSIQQKELINPITVTSLEDGSYKLVAGGRRYTACKYLGHTEIACRVYDTELTELELRSIEIEENIKRKDFTFLEECQAKRDLLEIQKAIHGEKTSTAPDASGVSMRDIAAVLGVSPATLSQDIKLAETVAQFPQLEWNKCKNKNEAMKLKGKIEETYIRAELAKRAEAAMGTKNLFLNKICNSYQIGDCIEGIKQLPENHFNLVEIDPPYAIDLKNQKSNMALNFGNEMYNEIPVGQYERLMRELFNECYRVMADNSWLLCWFGPEPWFNSIYEWLVDAKFTLRRIPCLWTKPGGQTMQPARILANSYEMFFYASKGSPVLAKEGRSNIFQYPPVPGSQKLHPTERPMEMITEVLTTFAFEGSKVLVPFAGSGNTLLAAAMNKMMPIGFDLTNEYRNSYVLKCEQLFGGNNVT